MRRKAGSLVPVEISILESGLALQGAGAEQFHGFVLAKAMADAAGARMLTAHGTLYKALRRLEDRGLLESEWEDPGSALSEGRPRRRLYRVTGEGAKALEFHRAGDPRVVLTPVTGRP